MPNIGQTLAGRYRLDARIGSGGVATVYRARDLRLDRDVAVKVLNAGQAMDPVVADRFDREARLLAAIDHPNVIAIHDVERADDSTDTEPFLVMDLAEAGSLAERLAEAPTGALTPDQLVPVLVDVASGLDALHSRGIVHRDLKPSNILLTEGRARIGDLGIAADGPSELTDAGTMVGTLAYLAPEQLAGQPATAASDVHALGVIAYLGLTGRLPRPAATISEVAAAATEPVRPISELVPSLGEAFDRAVSGALDRDPGARPSALELGASFGSALEAWQAAVDAAVRHDATTRMSIPIPIPPPSVAPAGALPVEPEAGQLPIEPEPAAEPVDPEPAPPPPAGDRRPAPSPIARRALPSERRAATVPGGLLAVIVLGVVAVVIALALLGDRPGGAPDASASAASLGPSLAASPTSPTPAASPDPLAEVTAASAAMRDAIAAARGGSGLKGKDAKALDDLLDAVDRALAKGDVRAAQDAAGKLSDRVAKLIADGAVEGSSADQLRAAAAHLEDLVAALP